MKKTLKKESAHLINFLNYRARIAGTSLEKAALQETYEEQDSNTKIFPRDVVTCMNNEEKIMNGLGETPKMEIPREIEDSMRKMLIIEQREEVQRKQLRIEIDGAERRLQQVVEHDAVNEKKLHDLCTQVELKYTNLLAKYDCDIGASYTLRENLLRDNEIIKAKIKSMEDQLVIQRELYVRFKKEQEIALTKAFEEKLEFLRRTRAARIIQRMWRTYFERISLKKRRKARRK